MKNMKFEINKDQPLDEVLEKLEGLGYKAWKWNKEIESNFVVTWEDGEYSNYKECPNFGYELTTLAELKEMK